MLMKFITTRRGRSNKVAATTKTYVIIPARVWNNLSLAVRSATSLYTFKKHFKTHLFQSSYSRWRFVLTVSNQLLRVLEVVAYGTLNLTFLTN